MIKLVPVAQDDTDKINELVRLSDLIWRQHYPSIITLEQIDYMLQKFHSATAIAAQITTGQLYFIITQDDVAVGYTSISIKENEVFLHKLYVDAKVHQKGVGGEALDLLIGNFGENKKIRLQVNRKNYTAINFYFKKGFKIETVADFDIGNGFLMEDFVMVKSLM
jgi:ribosomal protein S18 acetylase RimI-like enzyme